jgi:hypothetical protein
MKKIISFLTILGVLISINFININPVQAVNVNDIEKNLDFNKDGKVNGFDWFNMSLTQKQELITAYYSSSFQGYKPKMSESTREREIFRVINQLNYFYSGVNNQNKIVVVGDIYNLLIE